MAVVQSTLDSTNTFTVLWWKTTRGPSSHRQEMFCCNPSWHVGSWSL